MKELYNVAIFGDSESRFEGHYSKEEIDVIMKFLVDMDKNGVPHYDIPCVEFEKDGKIINTEDYDEEVKKYWELNS